MGPRWAPAVAAGTRPPPAAVEPVPAGPHCIGWVRTRGTGSGRMVRFASCVSGVQARCIRQKQAWVVHACAYDTPGGVAQNMRQVDSTATHARAR